MDSKAIHILSHNGPLIDLYQGDMICLIFFLFAQDPKGDSRVNGPIYLFNLYLRLSLYMC